MGHDEYRHARRRKYSFVGVVKMYACPCVGMRKTSTVIDIRFW